MMTIEQAKERLKTLQLEMYAFHTAEGCIYLDGATVAPKAGAEARGMTLGILSQKSYELFVNDGTRELLDTLLAHADELTQEQKRQATLLKRDYDDMTRIPVEEYAAYSKLTSDSGNAWIDAKANNDFESMIPYLTQLIDYNKRFAAYKDPSVPAYDAMLDGYEKGLTQVTLDAFFAELRKELVPIVLAVKDQPIDDSFLFGSFDIAGQQQLARELMDVMGLDKSFCVLATTEHPFTSSFNQNDVRITTHYHEDAVASSLYSVVHEGGHGLYDHGISEKYLYTCLEDVTSMSLHESQSRFYENIVGRSKGFCQFLLPKLQSIFPTQFQNVDESMLFKAVNKAQPSLIRTEADELTYCLHIMVRYELEKRLFDGTLKVRDLPGAWNEMYSEYLGVTVPDDAQGVLQDMHWYEGMFAYFPSYALGSAYGAQFRSVMQNTLDIDALAQKGNLAPITSWLRENIQQYGSLYDPKELLERVCGEPFDAKYYVRYLKEKMDKVYGG